MDVRHYSHQQPGVPYPPNEIGISVSSKFSVIFLKFNSYSSPVFEEDVQAVLFWITFALGSVVCTIHPGYVFPLCDYLEGNSWRFGNNLFASMRKSRGTVSGNQALGFPKGKLGLFSCMINYPLLRFVSISKSHVEFHSGKLWLLQGKAEGASGTDGLLLAIAIIRSISVRLHSFSRKVGEVAIGNGSCLRISISVGVMSWIELLYLMTLHELFVVTASNLSFFTWPQHLFHLQGTRAWGCQWPVIPTESWLARSELLRTSTSTTSISRPYAFIFDIFLVQTRSSTLTLGNTSDQRVPDLWSDLG
uniref:Uncharacterized protein n=1 Tax=Cannabis sativa TaxID=3483 RepID=A0A803QGL8_CANSA